MTRHHVTYTHTYIKISPLCLKMGEISTFDNDVINITILILTQFFISLIPNRGLPLYPFYTNNQKIISIVQHLSLATMGSFFYKKNAWVIKIFEVILWYWNDVLLDTAAASVGGGHWFLWGFRIRSYILLKDWGPYSRVPVFCTMLRNPSVSLIWLGMTYYKTNKKRIRHFGWFCTFRQAN